MQNFKEDKPQPVRDEYEYVSDDGELKIDEFPIRRKKNAPKRDLSCKLGDTWRGRPSPVGPSWRGWVSGVAGQSDPPTPVCFGLSLTGQEGASAHARFEAKAGRGALPGELLRGPRGRGRCAFCPGAAGCLLGVFVGRLAGLRRWGREPKALHSRGEAGAGCGGSAGLREGGPQERPARCHEDGASLDPEDGCRAGLGLLGD